MPPGPDNADVKKKSEKKPEKSYLASAVESINPWTSSRSTTPTPKDQKSTPTQKADDHATNPLYGLCARKYPTDCPPLKVQWFHASDIPKRKPVFLKSKDKEPEQTKPTEPKKFITFGESDSRSLEAAYQRLLEESDTERNNTTLKQHIRNRSTSRRSHALTNEDALNRDMGRDGNSPSPGPRVPVNEDFLFDVDIEERELIPVYWLGPVYKVIRGTWFYDESSGLRPCEENLAAQLEEGYLKVKPWTYPTTRHRSNSRAKDVTPKPSIDNLKKAAKQQSEEALKPLPSTQAATHQPQSHRLFGTYMNSVVTFEDSNIAFLSSDSVFNWVTTTVYERFAGSGYRNGIKLIRGYSKPKGKEAAAPAVVTQPTNTVVDGKQDRILKRRSAPPASRADNKDSDMTNEETRLDQERRSSHLKRELSSYIDNNDDLSEREEKIRQREENEIQEDYNPQDGETQGRDIEHLILVTHGIGQQLSMRMQGANFVHDVNMLRKTFKGVYAKSADLKALNSESGDGPGNSRIQVLPVCWRHLLDFPKKREKKGETDLSEAYDDEDDYPSLEDITIEGMTFARSLISDLALDVLLYQSGYRQQISEIVRAESNRIYGLFIERNPNFKGKVHIIGHSLGSAIMFDILCRQKELSKGGAGLRNPLRVLPSDAHSDRHTDPHDLSFDFPVEDFYCLGSPIGLFQMLKGRTILARHQANAFPSESPLNPVYAGDPFLSLDVPAERVSSVTGLPFSVSSPKVAQLFNIFHPADPISYRLEPLISPAMSSLKPQILPYTKKGFLDAVTPQGLSGIGAKVGQGFSDLWSSVGTAITNNILNTSLGISSEEMAKLNESSPSVDEDKAKSEKANARKKELARQQLSRANSLDPNSQEANNHHDMTLIDDDLETLYSKFQKKRVQEHQDSTSRAEEGQELGALWAAEESKAQKLRAEELKVRALNWNGRVDYSIQVGTLEFNPLAALSSHLSYWEDVDVSHFLCSQLLCNREARAKMYITKRQNRSS
ncbi:DDHD domain-containing protein [Xylariaceae sp. FL0255]|nr:DDHD domain-containing protein [Xylariaceae sp. FL0255]